MTQCEMIYKHLQDYGSITTAEAFNEYGITRLGSRIYDLRSAGHRITSSAVSRKNRYGRNVTFQRYALEDEVIT